MISRLRAAFKQAWAMSMPRLFAFHGRGALPKRGVSERRVAPPITIGGSGRHGLISMIVFQSKQGNSPRDDTADLQLVGLDRLCSCRFQCPPPL